MKFVETHFTRHYFFHAPHKWFLALLISPLHAAERHYKNKYRLTFRHAKKLFIFDLFLLLSLIGIGAASIGWWLYDPTVLDLVNLHVTPSQEKIQSGETVAYTFSYENKSDVILESPILSIKLPDGFVIASAEPPDFFDSQHTAFSLPPLPSGAAGHVTITGRFYDTPNVETEIRARLAYRQLGRDEHEVKVRRSLAILRGSVLETTLAVSPTLLSAGATRLEINLRNNGKVALTDVTLPLTQATGLALSNPTVTKGSVDNNVWLIPTLETAESVRLVATLTTDLPVGTDKTIVKFSPVITINNRSFPQVEASQTLAVVHPRATLGGTWQIEPAATAPGKMETITFAIKNTGDTTLTDLTLSLPLPSQIVDTVRLGRENTGRLSNNTFTVQKNVAANLSELGPGQSTVVSIKIPIRVNPDGLDIVLHLTPELTAKIPGVEQSTYRTTGTVPPLAIGTSLLLTSESRYYTDEGDQLGRGPLPPQVGKETKYWVLLRLTNRTSRVRDVSLSARLPSGVTWTGRTSVSLGNDLVFEPSSRTLRWGLSALEAKTTVGVYAELALTPTESNRGLHLPLLQNIRVNAHDTYIDTPLSIGAKDVDTSLPQDSLGRAKGTRVE